MEEVTLELTEKQELLDAGAVAVMGAIASVAVSHGIKKVYKTAMTAYRLKKIAAGEQ